MIPRNPRRLRIARLAVLVLTLGAAGGHAAEPGAAISPELVLGRFPIAGDGSALLLPVRFAGGDHLFVVDSGSGRTVFDLSLSLGKPRGRGTSLTFNGNVEVAVYDPPVASVGRLPLRVPVVTGADLSWVREVWGLPIEGILGMDFLGDHVLLLDFDRRELLFLKSLPKEAGEVIPIEWQPGELPGVMAGFADTERVRFAIDTGWTKDGSGTLGAFTASKLLLDDELRDLGSASSETLGGRYSSRVYRGRRLTLGGFSVEDPILKETPMVSVLGLGFWSRFTVTFDFPGRKAYLRKGGRYARPDLWNSSGLRLRSKSGAVTVVSVEEDSPGARAGVLAGDLLLEVGGLRAEKATLFELKSTLCKTGRLALDVRRGGQDHRFALDLRQ